MTDSKPLHLISVRSYTRPTVDVLLHGETLRRFHAHTVDEARAKAITYAEFQRLNFKVNL